MSIEKVLQKKSTPNPFVKFRKELSSFAGLGLITQLLTKNKIKKEVANFGLELLKLEDDYYNDYISTGHKSFHIFKQQVKSDMWEDPKYFNLLIYFFGSEKAGFVKTAWEKLPYKMYQSGYARRSFRAPNNKNFLLVNQINFLRSLLSGSRTYDYPNSKYYALSIIEQIRYDSVISQSENQCLIWAAAIEMGNAEVYQTIEDIIFNKDQVGKVSRGIIKALLSTNKKECWELVEKLLLSAQRQEGLRQTILEALDETSEGALIFMINTLVENKLTRFSSVVRAIDTWTGLGWEAEKEPTVRKTIELAQNYLTHPETIPAGINSKNNSEVYMALWSQGVFDIEKTMPYLHNLFDKGTIEKKCLALKFAGETNHPIIEMPLYFKALKEENLQILAFALPRMESLLAANAQSGYYANNPEFPAFFEKLYALAQSITVKTKSFESTVFSWLNVKFEKDTLFSCAINLINKNDEKLNLILGHFSELSVTIREKLSREILGDFYSYSFYSLKEKHVKKVPTDFQRSFALTLLKDRGEAMVSSAINTLREITLTEEEIHTFQDIFKRKNANLKKHLVEIILKQKESTIESFINELLNNGNIEQRISALDIMYQLQRKKILTKQVNDWAKEYQARTKLNEKEREFLDKLISTNKNENLTPEKGYGFHDPSAKSHYGLPSADPNSIFHQLTQKDKYGFSQPQVKIKAEIKKLHQLFLANSNFEYEFEQWNNTKETVLLGNTFTQISKKLDTWTPQQHFENYPLHTVWQKWMEDSGLVASDLFLLTFENRCANQYWEKELSKFVFYNHGFIPNPAHQNDYGWNNPLLSILACLKLKFPFKEKNEFLIAACRNLFANLPKSVLNFEQKVKKGEYNYSRNGNGWQSQYVFDIFLNGIGKHDDLSEVEMAQVWSLYRWRQFSGTKENEKHSLPPIHLYCEAYQQKLITKEEIYEGIIHTDRLSALTNDTFRINFFRNFTTKDLVTKYPFLQELIDEVRDTFLDVEMKRGESNTPVTEFVQSFQTIYGTYRFTQLLHGLGKGNLHKGYMYYWSGNEVSRQKLFSSLLKKCFPTKDDTAEAFIKAVKQHKFTEKRLIQAAIYAPQWQKFISEYLEWNGLNEGIWWLHAHTKTASYSSENSELESEVAKYSSVDLQDFKDGAVDKDWFVSAYKKLGKAKWELLYDSAKYVSDGNGHRRARLYADTLTGNLKIREVTAKVKDKRDQDFLRVYGLVPLSKTNPEKDVLNRYEYLIQFKKESREFGSMRQTSEALAVRVAMENLARNAGYPDPIRLSWAMETKQIQGILAQNTRVVINDTTVGLEIDAEGKAQLITEKGDKKLKSIPVKIKKDPAIVELTKHRKVMREQWTRSKKGLEEAMIRGDVFLREEMQNLFDHPVICKHLEKLVFISNDEQIGFYSNGTLISAKGEETVLKEDATFRIAHCFDLHNNEVWQDFQRHCFDQKLKQPFKQIFRELYVPTPDELKEKSISRRYAGHQVQPKQTLALLKTRGWKVDYEEGLQKVFHTDGFQVKLYAMADWFSPADVESPTLETIEFHSLKDYKNIPFEDINPRIFSEVMRDIDLVVSVAHVGGVDPETSHSTIEMRTILLRETLRLFKIDTVEFNKNHAVIHGKLADYSLHLGSAVVHQIPGKYLSILPVHSQHRGRLFLPFADDDPKSAEVMSKALLLAKDDEIQDPTVLSQINRLKS